VTIFHYIAVDEQGRSVSGTIDAIDWQAAEQALVASGMREPRSAAAAEKATETLGASDAVELARYLTELAKSGLPLDGGLRAIAKDLPAGQLSRAIGRLAAQLEAGQPLSLAIESFGTRLPPHLRELMVAGARSGNLAQTLDKVLAQESQVDDLGRQLRQAIAYPTILLLFLAAWMLFVSLLVLPQIDILNLDDDIGLSGFTRAVLGFSRAIPGVILGIAIACLIIFAAGRAKGTAALVSRLWSRLPWIGPAWWYRGLVEFSGLMGVFLQQGMSLPEALRLTSLAARDAAIGKACRRMADETAGGQALSTCLARRSLFPPTLVSTMAWGESHAALAEACHSARRMFRERLESQTELIRLVLPPIIFLVLGASVVVFVIGLLSGLLKLITDLAS
jgi:general secretion pathway protein F